MKRRKDMSVGGLECAKKDRDLASVRNEGTALVGDKPKT